MARAKRDNSGAAGGGSSLTPDKTIGRTTAVPRKKSEEDWVKTGIALFDYSDHKRYAAWLRWNEAWRVYNNQWDFSQKANWQSKTYLPKVFITVEMAASMVRRAMIDANEWFRYKGTTQISREMAPILEKLAYYYLDAIRFKDALIPPLKGGFVGSLIVLKPHLAPYTMESLDEEELEKQAAGEYVRQEILEGPALQVSYPDPYNIWLDPSGRDLYIIEREQVDFAHARDLADMGILDHDALDKIDEDWQDWDREVREEKRREQFADTTRPEYRREVELLHFWGSIPNRDGTWLIRNGHFVIGNRKWLVRKPMDNPYKHGKKPYIVGSPFRKPFSVYHKGMVEDVVSVVKTMTELINLSLDSTKFSGIKAFELDVDQVDDPQQILTGLYPGKMFTKHGALSQQQRMIQEINMENTAEKVLPVYQVMQTEYQNHTAVTEFISGAASTSPGRSATEVLTKQQQGMGVFGEISRNVEGSVLEPFLEMWGQLIVQFHDDFYSPAVVEILGDELALELALSNVDERWQQFEPHKMRVRADGVSSLLNRTEELQKVNSFMQTIGQFAAQLPIVMAGYDIGFFFKALFTKAFQAFGWNESDFFRPDQSGGAGPAGPAQGGSPQPTQGAQPQQGQPAPANPISQTAGQMENIRAHIASGQVPPNGAMPPQRVP